MLEKHFRFHIQPFAEHTPAERLWPDDRLTQGLARLRYLTVFRDLDAYNALDEYLRGLPGVGKPELLIRYPRTTDWQRAAERGLFAFNYESGWPDGYRLVARPAAPLSMCLSEACLRGESFAEGTERVADLSGVRCGLVS